MSAPPYVATVEKLIALVARTDSGRSLDALYMSSDFREDFDSLPKKGRDEVIRAAKAHRTTFLARAG